MIIRIENKINEEISVEVSLIYESKILKPMSSTYVEPYNPNAEKIRRIDVTVSKNKD